MTPAELTRWETSRAISLPPMEPDSLPAALSGRQLGPLYRKDCCVGPERLLAHGSLEVPATQAGAAQRFQKILEREQRRRLCNHLIDRARGISHWSLANWERAEKPLWEVLASMDQHFHGVAPMADPAEEANALALADDFAKRMSATLAHRPKRRVGSPPGKSSNSQ